MGPCYLQKIIRLLYLSLKAIPQSGSSPRINLPSSLIFRCESESEQCPPSLCARITMFLLDYSSYFLAVCPKYINLASPGTLATLG